jgi:glycosyltransferase involved in cell wall biosynthesis
MSIKVLILNKKFKGGPQVFRSRISKCLNDIPNIKVIDNEKIPFDVELCFINNIIKHNKPIIIRIDGCYYVDRLNFNEQIRNSIKRSNFIIYQSNFSKKMCEHILKIKKPCEVIYNGIDLDYINKIEPNKTIEPGSFVACSNTWRNTKRPLSMLKGFLKANTGRHFYIIGDIKNEIKIKNNNIHYLGLCNSIDIISIMKACQYQIHLCHIDSCPNAVVEGLACGLNVLCTNLGGTPELVKENGVILNVDKWKHSVINKQDLDVLSSNIIAEGINNLLKIQEKAIRPDLDIKLTAQKYADIIKRIYQ